jgi:uncharacterized protein YyaL (SSP411 family)
MKTGLVYTIKNIFIILLILLLLPFASAAQEKINWLSFEEAVEQVSDEPRHIFVDVYTDWCGWCKRMDASTFADPVIVDIMNSHYYAVKLDAEQKDTIFFMDRAFINPDPDGRRSSHQMAQALLKGQMSYPSFVFLSPKTEWLTSVAGFRKAPEMEQMLTYFGEGIYKEKTWEQFLSTFQSRIPGESAR